MYWFLRRVWNDFISKQKLTVLPVSNKNTRSFDIFRVGLNEIISTPIFQRTIIIVLSVTLLFTKLGGNGLATYDDAFYAQKAKELLWSGDWWTLYYDGVPEFQNPPLFIWMVALSFRFLGINDFAAILPSALMGVITILFVYEMGNYFFNKWSAFYSAGILATTFLFTRYARRAMVDVTLTFFITLAIFCFILALRKNPAYFLGFGLSTAMAILTKSVLGLFPFVIILIFVIIKRKWRSLISPYFYIGGIIAIILGFSWHIINYVRFGDEFIRVHFLWLIFERAKQGLENSQVSWIGHFSYVRDFLYYYWPWLPVFIWAIIKNRSKFKTNELKLILLIWSSVYFIVMSMMETRFLWYLLPMIPAASLLCGNAIAESIPLYKKLKFSKIELALICVLMLLVITTPINFSKERVKDIRAISPLVKYYARQGTVIIAFRFDFYGLNNALLFYSDHSARPVVTQREQLEALFNGDETVLCVLKEEDISEIKNYNLIYYIVTKTKKICLISNQPLTVINEDRYILTNLFPKISKRIP